MALVELKLNPTERELRWFGALLALFAALVGGILRVGFDAPRAALWVWAVGAGLALLHLLVPGSRRTLYRAWMGAFFPVGWLVSHTVLVVVYYLVLTPLAVVLRLVGHDPFERAPSVERPTSYWTPSEPDGSAARYFRQS